MIYLMAFYVPAGLIALCWVVFLWRATSERRAPLLWLAFGFTVAAALAAVWAMGHRPQLRSRSFIDYHYEIGALFASLMGFGFGVAWSVRPRQGLCWLPTISSAWLALLWLIVMTTG